MKEMYFPPPIVTVPVRAVVWSLGVTDKGDGVPSLSKVMALGFAVATGRDVWANGCSAVNVSAMALLCSIALGRAMFQKWLDRWQFTASTNISKSVALTGDLADVVRAVQEGRDHERGVDPA